MFDKVSLRGPPAEGLPLLENRTDRHPRIVACGSGRSISTNMTAAVLSIRGPDLDLVTTALNPDSPEISSIRSSRSGRFSYSYQDPLLGRIPFFKRSTTPARRFSESCLAVASEWSSHPQAFNGHWAPFSGLVAEVELRCQYRGKYKSVGQV